MAVMIVRVFCDDHVGVRCWGRLCIVIVRIITAKIMHVRRRNNDSSNLAQVTSMLDFRLSVGLDSSR